MSWYSYLNPLYDINQLGAAAMQPVPQAGAQQNQIMGMLGQAAPQLNGAPQDQFRQQQLAQISQLQGIANGTQQGAGELAVQRQIANAQAAQQASARMVRGGGNAGMAYRNAANNTAGIGLSGAGQSQQAALQDQTNAQGMLTGALNNGRSQDIGFAGQNAQLQGQNYGQNLGALGAINQGSLAGAQAQANQANAFAGSVLNTAGQLGAAYLRGPSSNDSGGPQAGQAVNPGWGGPGPSVTYSDERLKTGVRDAGAEIDEMLDRLSAKSYRYKNEDRHGRGERAGIMAQDMLKSKAGARVVFDAPDGKALDINKAISAALASSARLNERMRKLEAA